MLAERRGEGLGRRAVEHALEACFERGVVRAEFFFTAGNRPLVRLLSALGAEVTLVNGYACIPRPLAAAA